MILASGYYFKTKLHVTEFGATTMASVHGSRCSHVSSECYVLHPELNPTKKADAAVEEGDVTETGEDSVSYGFMNEDLGY